MSLRSEVIRIFRELVGSGKKITELPAATTPLAGTELLEIVQNGGNKKITASSLSSGGTGVQTIIAGTNISVDDTDPQNPIVSVSGGGSVLSVNGDGVDNTDPENPVISYPTIQDIDAAPIRPTPEQITTDYEFLIGDEFKILVYTGGGTATVTVPQDVFPVGTWLFLSRVDGAGVVTFAPGGTTALEDTRGDLDDAGNGTITPLYQRDTNVWQLLNGSAGGAGSVTSVGIIIGTAGTDVGVSGSPVTSSGDITLDIPDASATARGLVTTGAQTIAGAKTFSSTIIGSVNGNSATATALSNGRTIAITGDIAYTSPSFDGTGNVTAAGTLATVNSDVGSFGSTTQVPVLTVNGKGLITGVTTVTVATSGTAWQLTGTSTLNAPTLDGSYALFQRNNIGGTPSGTTGLRLENNTAVVSGTPVTTQVSPAISLKANGWASTSSSSRSVEFRTVVTPVAGTANPNGYYLWQSSINGGAFQDCMRLNNAGNLEIFGTVAASMPLGSGTEVLSISGSAKQFTVTQEGLVTLHTVGSGIRIKEGTNASMGVSTLVAGTVTVNNTRITANSRILLTVSTPGGTQGFLSYSKVAATSFTITSTSATETSVVTWLIIEPAP